MAYSLVRKVPCGTTDSHNNVVNVMLLNVKGISLSRTDMFIERLIHSPVRHCERLRAEIGLANSVAEKALDYLFLVLFTA
jgi:hypothetical protein